VGINVLVVVRPILRGPPAFSGASSAGISKSDRLKNELFTNRHLIRADFARQRSNAGVNMRG
jgi:hypothetical protein